MKKNGLTLDEHRDVGAGLRLNRNEFVSLSVKIINAYPKDVVEDLDKAIKLIDSVRSNLDDQVIEENPELDDADLLSIYF
jgi:hypothetical protein